LTAFPYGFAAALTGKGHLLQCPQFCGFFESETIGKSIRQAAHLVQAPNTSDFFVKNTVDLKVFNTIYEASFDVGPEIRHVGLIASAVTESDDSDSDLPGDNDLLEDDLSSDDED
jgi:hypothetical protein